jgi:hypothetical protein
VSHAYEKNKRSIAAVSTKNYFTAAAVPTRGNGERVEDEFFLDSLGGAKRGFLPSPDGERIEG